MKKDFNKNLVDFIKLGAFFVVIILSFYFINFGYLGLSDDQEVWAQFGDYLGGVLNPIFAFLAFIALLITIKLQNEALQTSKTELELTRKELAKSAKAQEEQSKSLELQNKATELQIFENTFFQLLKQHNEYLNFVVEEKVEIEYFTYNKNNFGEDERTGLVSKEDVYQEFRKINQSKRVVKNYFMTLYQVLKYIDEHANRDEINAKFYTNIVRALIDDEILRLLAINCNAYNSYSKYKEYIEKYAFFEHIYLNEKEEKTKTIVEILSNYKSSAFDKNDKLKELIKNTR